MHLVVFIIRTVGSYYVGTSQCTFQKNVTFLMCAIIFATAFQTVRFLLLALY